MSTLWLLAALVVAGLGGWLRQRREIAGQVLMVLGGLGLMGVVAWQIRQNVFPAEPKPPDRGAMAISYCLANCLLSDLGSQSGRVVLLFPQSQLMDAETERNYEDGFTPPLRHARAKLSLKVVRLQGGVRQEGASLQAFSQALDQVPDAIAVVSYAGVPRGFETSLSARQTNKVSYYVFDPRGTTNWLGALKAGWIRAVVLPRPGVSASGRRSLAGTPEVIFDQLYVVATPANADEVLANLKGKE